MSKALQGLQFRDILRKIGNYRYGFEYEGVFYTITNFYGETDLLPCPNHCIYQRGFYALVSPRRQGQTFLEVVYQCSWCDTMTISLFDIKKIRNYPEDEKEFVAKLINDVLVKHTKKGDENIIQRQQIDVVRG